jgi:hypothetical protein
MATPEIDALRKHCQEILKPELATLIARPQWGSFNFVEWQAELLVLRAAAEATLQLSDSMLTPHLLPTISQAIQEAVQAVNLLDRFALSASEAPAQQRDRVVGAIGNAFATAKDRLVPLLIVLGLASASNSPIIQKLRSTNDEMEKIRTDAHSEFESALKDIEAARSAAKAAAAKTGVEIPRCRRRSAGRMLISFLPALVISENKAGSTPISLIKSTISEDLAWATSLPGSTAA